MSAATAALAALVPGRDFDVLLIGGSAGAFSALRAILPALRAPELVTVVVLHQGPQGGELATLFDGIAGLPCSGIEDKLPAQPGTIYFAPPGYHLLIEQERSFALSVDAPVNFSRPSLDVTFASAAEVYGPRLVAVVLTGASDDGTDGVRRIAEAGGIALVQDPADAEVPLMPQSALRQGHVRAALRLAQLAELFASWSGLEERRA